MKQLIVVADMEGASGIFEHNRTWLYNGKDDWRKYGRECITSDVLAVCNAAFDFGVDDIMLYDMHWAGDPEFNVILEKLPPKVRVFDVPDRGSYWRRMRGQAVQNPFGVITVGQHARYGEANAYFPHTIQSPPIKHLLLNGLRIAEIGVSVLSFNNAPYLANIGCQASMTEALELSKDIVCIPVKDKAKNWEPSPKETYPLIYKGVMKALQDALKARHVEIRPPYHFSMELCEGFEYNQTAEISWKGTLSQNIATWQAPTIEIGLELFDHVRELLRKLQNI